jgi:hypothetical protein
MQGLCTGHENPDLWFSESVDSDNERVGTNENAPEYKQRIANVVSAIAICNVCPSKGDCLTEGLKHENLENGIWGGSLPGERLLLVNASLSWGGRRSMVRFAQRVRSYTV